MVNAEVRWPPSEGSCLSRPIDLVEITVEEARIGWIDLMCESDQAGDMLAHPDDGSKAALGLVRRSADFRMIEGIDVSFDVVPKFLGNPRPLAIDQHT